MLDTMSGICYSHYMTSQEIKSGKAVAREESMAIKKRRGRKPRASSERQLALYLDAMKRADKFREQWAENKRLQQIDNPPPVIKAGLGGCQ